MEFIDIDPQLAISVIAPILTWFFIAANASRIARRGEERTTCNHLVGMITGYADKVIGLWLKGEPVLQGQEESILSMVARIEIYSKIISLDKNARFISALSDLRDWATLDIEEIAVLSEPDRNLHVVGIATACEDALSAVEGEYLRRYHSFWKRFKALVQRFLGLFKYRLRLEKVS